jgi:potassium voltage-gated channel KQT-like subfamily protein 1
MASGMNRSEQEQLYRQSREVIIKASSSRESLDGVSSRRQGTGDDILLSVLKSPIISSCPGYTHQQRNNHQQKEGASSGDDDDGVFEDQGLEERRRLRASSDEAEDNPVTNQSAPEATSRFSFFGEHLRPFRNLRGPRFREAHHKRVPTPIKRRHRRYNDASARYRTESEDLEDEDIEGLDEEEAVDRVETVRGSGHAGKGPPGVPDPYYPIYLPIDQAFKAKYVFHHKKGKTFQERVYVFLEHPAGWLCFVYHFTV